MAIRAPKSKPLTPAAKAKAKVDEAVAALRAFAPKARAVKRADGWYVALTLPTTRRLTKQLDEAQWAQKERRESRVECQAAIKAREEATAHIDALKRIMTLAGVPVPEDPPPEPPGKGRYVHRVPGSFENGKRR